MLIVIQPSYRSYLKELVSKFSNGCMICHIMSTTYANVRTVLVLTEIEGLNGVIHLPGKPYFGLGTVMEFYA